MSPNIAQSTTQLTTSSFSRFHSGKLLVSSSSLLIAASIIFLVTSYVVKYGPEYYGGYHVCMAMVSHAMQDNTSGAPAEFLTLTIAPTFIFLSLFVRSLESSPKVVYGKKVRDKMMKFRMRCRSLAEMILRRLRK